VVLVGGAAVVLLLNGDHEYFIYFHIYFQCDAHGLWTEAGSSDERADATALGWDEPRAPS
jgi:hypothetical protein